MDSLVEPGQLGGSIPAIPSKSVAHRALICAALADEPTQLRCPSSSVDIHTTLQCLRAIGAHIEETSDGFVVYPVRPTGHVHTALDCKESGSTLRFMLPVVGALGINAHFIGQGRLAQRPLSPLYEEMIAAGCELSEQGTFPLHISGKLRAGQFELAGDVSSQFITGILLAAPLMDGEVRLRVSKPIQSRPYINITKDVMRSFGVEVHEISEPDDVADAEGTAYTTFVVEASAAYTSAGHLEVEGDWSNAAFWLAAGAISTKAVSVSGLNLSSSQGDRAILGALARLGARVSYTGSTVTVLGGHLRAAEIDVRNVPDLVPPLALVAALAQGTTRFSHAERLRLKESDRLASVSSCINALGGRARIDGDDLIIEGVKSFSGGVVESAADHRICMQAAIAATQATQAVTIRGTECVAKSYPGFFDDFRRLGGMVQPSQADGTTQAGR